MNNIIRSLTSSIIIRMHNKSKDTASDIINAIALAELEETISVMCYDGLDDLNESIKEH